MFTPPDCPDLGTSSPNLFAGVITCITNSIHGSFGATSLRWLSSRDKSHLGCTQEWQKVTEFKLLFRNRQMLSASCQRKIRWIWHIPLAECCHQCDKYVTKMRKGVVNFHWLLPFEWLEKQIKIKIQCNRESIILWPCKIWSVYGAWLRLQKKFKKKWWFLRNMWSSIVLKKSKIRLDLTTNDSSPTLPD